MEEGGVAGLNVASNSIILVSRAKTSKSSGAKMADSKASEEEVQDVYRVRLNKLQEMRVSCKADDLKLPNLCVIGDQSSGKSSLLCSVVAGMDGILPTGENTVTLTPIVVHSKKFHESYVEVDGKRFELTEQGKREANGFIMRCMKQNLDKHNNESITSDSYSNARAAIVCDHPVVVEFACPTAHDIVLVDLPGIIHEGVGKESVEKMSEKYIKEENALIIVVREAMIDKERVKARDLARKYDPFGTRTVEILTKCDVDTGENNIRKIIEFMNDAGDSVLFHPHLVCCKPKKQFANEEEFFKESSFAHLPPGQITTQSLAGTRLPLLLSRLIDSNLDNLKSQIQANLEQARATLNEIGENEIPGEIAFAQLRKHIRKHGRYQAVLTPSFTKFDQSVRSTVSLITREWSDEFYVTNCLVPSFLDGHDAFILALDAFVCQKWEPLVTELLNDVYNMSFKIFPTLSIKGFDRLDTNIENAITESWAEYGKQVFEKYQAASKAELNKKKEFATLNHYLDSKYNEEMALPESAIDEFCNGLDNSDFLDYPKCAIKMCSKRAVKKYADGFCYCVDHLKSEGVEDSPSFSLAVGVEDSPSFSLAVAKKSIKEKLSQMIKHRFEHFFHASLEERQKERLCSMIKANFSVSCKTIIDNMLEVFRDTMALGWHTWIEEELLADHLVLEACREPERVRKCRDDNKSMIERMEKCYKLVMEMQLAKS